MKKDFTITLKYREGRGIITSKEARENISYHIRETAAENQYTRNALKKALCAILRASKRESMRSLEFDIETDYYSAHTELLLRVFRGWQEVENDVIEVLTPQPGNLALQSAKVSDQQCKKIILAIFDRMAKEAETETEAA